MKFMACKFSEEKFMEGQFVEGKRHRCVGWASNPVGGAMRRRVGSTPIPLRQVVAVLASSPC